jgi:hypothetical protein
LGITEGKTAARSRWQLERCLLFEESSVTPQSSNGRSDWIDFIDDQSNIGDMTNSLLHFHQRIYGGLHRQFFLAHLKMIGLIEEILCSAAF